MVSNKIMKRSVCLLLALPLLVTAQKTLPRFENDTLYTSSGYKIYRGQTLSFGKGSGRNGRFRFINVKNPGTGFTITNNSIVVKKLWHFGISTFGHAYIEITGVVLYKDGTKGSVDIHMAFDSAIANSPAGPGELIVPAEFSNKQIMSIPGDTSRLYFWYINGLFNKDQYEKQKKKLLRY